MYTYATYNLVDDVRHRMNDHRTTGQRYSEGDIREAIIKACRWAEPLGELITFDIPVDSYNSTPQTSYLLSEILQIEARVPTGPQVIVPPSLWNFMRARPKVLRLTYPPTTETLIVTGMLQNQTDGMEYLGDISTTVKIDPTVLELYASSYLYEREAQWNSPGSVSSETNRAMEYRSQAENRKAQMLEEIRSVYRAIPIVEGDPVSTGQQTRRSSRSRA